MPEGRWTGPAGAEARAAGERVRRLQARMVAGLTALGGAFQPAVWLRDGGGHGGGERLEAAGDGTLQRASVNVSEVQYDDDPEARIASATALSAIVHPLAPAAPSLHLHVSLTVPRAGRSTWRVMADLNPALPLAADTAAFREALRAAAPGWAGRAFAAGDAYFRIPALDRWRGVVHFYLEGLATSDAAEVADAVAVAAMDTHADLLRGREAEHASEAELQAQRGYHTVYLLQVLTLDRGTTAGLLVHDQNDVGTLGSLPAGVDRELLASWRPRLVEAQRPLLDAIVACLPADGGVGAAEKVALARALRAFYRQHPGAIDLQAAVAPPVGLG